MKRNRKILALMLALCTMLLLAAPALAASTMQATTALNVRSGPGTKYAIVGELYKGQTVTVNSTTGNWAYITYANGAKGYASLSYLKGTSSSGSGAVSSGNMVATAAVNVRSGPSTSYAKAGELAKGQVVEKVGTYGNWTMINWNGGVAYVSSAYLATYGGSSSGSVQGKELMKATAAVNVRSGPGTSYSIVGALYKNDTVYSTGVTTGSWMQVVYRNQVAYVSKSYLTPASGSSSSSDGNYAYATTDMKVYMRASTSSSIRGYLEKGQKVEVVSVSGSWTCIRYGSRLGYVRSYNLTDEEYSVKDTTGIVYATSSVPVRSGPSTSYKILGYLYSGNSAVRTGVSGSWTRIQFDGQAGYVQSDRVKVITGSNGNMTTAGYYLYCKADSTAAYSIPNASSAYRLGYLYKGERVWCTAKNSSWAQLLIQDTVMYVPMSKLSESRVSGSGSSSSIGTAYIRYDDTDLYNRNSTSSSIVVTLDKGAKVTVLDYSATWVYVKYSFLREDYYGYVKASWLEWDDDDDEDYWISGKNIEAYVLEDDTDVYKNTSTSSKVVITLYEDDEVTIQGFDGIWAYVKYSYRGNVYYGYMKKADLDW